MSERNCLTFSIIAKIFLPRNISDTIAKHISEFKNSKITLSTLNQNITQLVEYNEVVYKCWVHFYEDRNLSQIEEFSVVYEIVKYFDEHSLSIFSLFQFIGSIVTSTREGFSNVYVLTQVLLFCIPRESNAKISNLMLMADKLSSIVQQQQCIYFDKINPLVLPDLKCLYYTKEDLNFPSVSPQKDYEENKQSQKPIKVDYSYTRVPIPLVNSTYVLLYNTTTKSALTGSEAHIQERISESQRFLTNLDINMFNKFENLVIADQYFWAMLTQGHFEGIFRRNVITLLYPHNDMIPYSYDSYKDVLEQRCGEMLLKFHDFRVDVHKSVDEMTNYIPKFDYSLGKVFSQMDGPYTFNCRIRDHRISDFLLHIGHNFNFKELVFFLNDVLPLIDTSNKEYVSLIGTDTIANAIYIFSNVAEAIYQLFHVPDFDKDYYNCEIASNDIKEIHIKTDGDIRLEDLFIEDSPSSLLWMAENEVSMRYDCQWDITTIKYIEYFFKKFKENIDEFHNFFPEMEERLGKYAKHLYSFMMQVTKLISVCSRFSAQDKLRKIVELGKFYGRCYAESQKNADEHFEARFPLYYSMARRHILMPLVKIEVLPLENQVTVTPIHNI